MARCFLGSFFLLALCASARADIVVSTYPMAGELGIYPSLASGLSLFGETANFNGQTGGGYSAQLFVAPENSVSIKSLKLSFNPAPFDSIEGTDFHLLLTDVTGSGFSTRPNNVLFESATQNVPFGTTDQTIDLTIDLGNTPLTAGTRYAWVLDSFVTRNDIPGNAFVRRGSTAYPDGYALAITGFKTGTRAQHFEFWALSVGSDLAFEATFATVPEPSTFALAGFGLVGVVALWRRIKAAKLS